MFETVRRWAAKTMPRRETLEGIRWLAPFAHRIFVPALWRFTRRSVPRGVALGLLVGIFLMIPGVQIAGAALFALPCRANIPIAAAMTFLSNPATTPLILAASLFVGNRMLGMGADVTSFMLLFEKGASFSEWVAWAFSEAAPAMIFGLAVIAIVSAAIGYVVSALGWRLWISHKWALRGRNRAIRHA